MVMAVKRILAVGLTVFGALGAVTSTPAGAYTPRPRITGITRTPSTITAGWRVVHHLGHLRQHRELHYFLEADVSGIARDDLLRWWVDQPDCLSTSECPQENCPVQDHIVNIRRRRHHARGADVKVKPGAGGGPLPTLTGVSAMVSDGSGYCALFGSGGVNCWGSGSNGDLGNGTFYTASPGGSATPVQVVGVGGTGTLSGVASLVSDATDSYCALLSSGAVECWGEGQDGQLGNGSFYTSGSEGSAIPVQVVGVGGTGTLSGVASLVSASSGGIDSGYCALLTTGEVDCWGDGPDGELGDGNFVGSAMPVQVVDVGGTGILSGVESLSSDGRGYCALLTTDEVDCWGAGPDGELGDGTFYTLSPEGSAIPVQVVGVGGTGTLSGVESLANDAQGYCAILTSGDVDCWGYGQYGELGNGTFYTSGDEGSATPVQVVDVGGTGTLSGVESLAGDGGGYCAELTAGTVDCWGVASSETSGTESSTHRAPLGAPHLSRLSVPGEWGPSRGWSRWRMAISSAVPC